MSESIDVRVRVRLAVGAMFERAARRLLWDPERGRLMRVAIPAGPEAKLYETAADSVSRDGCVDEQARVLVAQLLRSTSAAVWRASHR